MPTENDLQEPLLERRSASPEAEDSKRASKKRKRGTLENDSKTASKKTRKAKAIEEDEIDIELGINNAFSHMDNQLLADYLAQRTRKYESDLSTIELEDKYIPGRYRLASICGPSIDQVISGFHTRYDFLEPAEVTRKPAGISGKSSWEFDKVMVCVEEEWSSSYNHSGCGRTQSCKYCSVGYFVFLRRLI
jgi:hypothetical protein